SAAPVASISSGPPATSSSRRRKSAGCAGWGCRWWTGKDRRFWGRGNTRGPWAQRAASPSPGPWGRAAPAPFIRSGRGPAGSSRPAGRGAGWPGWRRGCRFDGTPPAAAGIMTWLWEQAAMSMLQQFLEELAKAPEDWKLRGVMADWCEDNQEAQ